MFFNAENGCLYPYFSRDGGFSPAKQEHNAYSILSFSRQGFSIQKNPFSEGTKKKKTIYLFKEFPLKQYSKIHACLQFFMSESVCITTALD